VSSALSAAATDLELLDGLRLNYAFRAGIVRLLARQEYLNKINVFPVPDGDTGTNLAITMGAVLGVLQRVPDAHAGNTLTRVADAALDGARGNSGAILAQFLLGVGDRLGDLARIGPDDLAAGAVAGAEYARESLSEPREGTILSVIADFAREAAAVTRESATTFRPLLARAVRAAEESLAQTTLQLEALRRANVVDAGAQGFVELVSGVADYIVSGSDAEPEVETAAVTDASAIETAGDELDLEHRWCTECIVSGEGVDRRRLREALSSLGGSLVVGGLAHKARVHIHASDPAAVFRVAAQYGRVSGEKADDMQRQQRSAHARNRRVAIVTDSAADIPEDEMDRLDIHMVPARVHFGEHSYLDKIGITPEEFFGKIERGAPHPKTSQPPPGDFRRRFEFLASHHDSVLSINLTRKVSGTIASAEAAAVRTSTHGEVHVLDSLNASAGQGLIVLHAAERAHAGAGLSEVVAAVRAILPVTFIFGLMGSLEYAVRGGRVPRWTKRIADALRLMPVLGIDVAGRLRPVGVLLGRRNLHEKFARFVERRMSADRSYRVLVGHADRETDGQWLLERLRGDNVSWARLVPLGSAIGAHGGPGTLVVGLQEQPPLQ
jgi:DegV family protein with EDD domain